MNVCLLSGEMSGDAVGGALARALQAARPDISIWGMGSRRMREAGVELLYDSGSWSAIGVVEALKVYPELRLKILPHVLREIDRRKPSVVVLIDFGAFNVKVARYGKARDVPILYYFPPGSWKRAGRINAEIARITDRIATPFPWSAERLAGVGANVEFVGHPLLELAHPSMTRAQFANRFGMEPGRPIVGLLPGSRGFEVEHNTPAMIEAACLIHREMPETQFVFGLASESARQQVEAVIAERQRSATQIVDFKQELARRPVGAAARSDRAKPKLVTPEGILVDPEELERKSARRTQREASPCVIPPVVLAEGMAYDVMAHSDALLVCSGTATLEAAVLGTPMVILYRGSRLMEMEYKLRRVKVEHIGMPNIVAGERIVPEFIQHDATPEALAESALRFLRDPEARAKTKSALQGVRAALGEPGASERVALFVLDMAGARSQAGPNAESASKTGTA